MRIAKSLKGMTIAELMIALAILGIVSVGFIGFFTDSFKFQSRNEQVATMQKIAEETMETLKNNFGEVEIGSKKFSIKDMEKDESARGVNNHYYYVIKVNDKIDGIANTLYDITVELTSIKNYSILASVSSTVKIPKETWEDDNDEDELLILAEGTEWFSRGISEGKVTEEDLKEVTTLMFMSTSSAFTGGEETWYADTDNNGSILCMYGYNVLAIAPSSEYELSDNQIPTYLTEKSLLFTGLKSLKSISFEYINLKNITETAKMFESCNSLTSLDLSKLDTSKVTDMSNMFKNCFSLKTINGLNSFDTSKVTNMSQMFWNCGIAGDLHLTFDTTRVSNAYEMFYNCDNLTKLSLTSAFIAVDSMKGMFETCSKLTQLDISNFSTYNVKDMSNMFRYCNVLQNINGLNSFDTTSVTNMSSMFEDCFALEELDLSGWNTSKVTNMSKMFMMESNVSSITSKLEKLVLNGNFNVNSVTSSTSMFKGLSNLKYIKIKSGFNKLDYSGLEDIIWYKQYQYSSPVAVSDMMKNGGTYVSIREAKVTFKDEDQVIEQKKVDVGSSVALTIGDYEKPGYILTGWKLEGGTRKKYNYGDTIESLTNTNLVLVAVYEKLELGDSIVYTPSTEEYGVASIHSGADIDTQMFYPSKVTDWKVCSNNNNIIEIISTDSVGDLTLQGIEGYANLVQVLQDIAKAYVNSTYAQSGRNPGYDGTQTLSIYTIITPKKLIDAIDSGNTALYEDTCDKFISRLVDNTIPIWFSERYLDDMSDQSGKGSGTQIYLSSSTKQIAALFPGEQKISDVIGATNGVRPIITLNNSLKASSGDGTEASPYVLTK